MAYHTLVTGRNSERNLCLQVATMRQVTRYLISGGINMSIESDLDIILKGRDIPIKPPVRIPLVKGNHPILIWIGEKLADLIKLIS